MPKFRKKPIVIDAVRVTQPMAIDTLEGTMTAGVGDWLITGVNGEMYPCKDDIFRKTYEAVDHDGWLLFGDYDDNDQMSYLGS
jgi:hypothetical protein